MDRGARDIDIVNGRVGKGISALLLLALLAVGACCHRGAGGWAPPPAREEAAGDNTAPGAETMWLPPVVATEGAGREPGASPAGITAIDNLATSAPEAIFPGSIPPPEANGESDAFSTPDNAARSVSSPSARAAPGATSPADTTPSVRRPKPVAAPHPAPPAQMRGESPPAWAKSPEELVYRVDFLGITMGYARFRYVGKASIAGKPVYHLNVRAWTSGVLSYIYPINDTIDYYLDAETIAPLRQEYTKRVTAEDDVALYDQETGKITYRYRQSGEIHKQVTTIPSVYDPVSIAYYFRWKDLGVENRPRNMYGGRKVYQVSSRILGNERIRTDHGEVDTIAVVPVIRRDGKLDDKGDLKIWFSADERRVPVRLYAKFRKIKEWTLVGELVPPAGKTGG